jgi:hypothetical protein
LELLLGLGKPGALRRGAAVLHTACAQGPWADEAAGQG